MKYFMYKLIPPRSTFNLDMNAEEAAVMQSHIQYWNGLFAERKTLIYGPVLDPKGVFGLAIIEVETEEKAQAIISKDPAITSGINKYELWPMMPGYVRQ